MQISKNKNGITLMALVVTIIILLILTGISIASLTNSGLFDNAKLAKEKSNEAQKKEEGTLADYENKIGEYVDATRRDDYTKLKEEIENLKKEVNTFKLNNSGLVVFDKDNIIQDTITCTAGTEYMYTATQDCAIRYQYYFKLGDGGSGNCAIDDIIIEPVYCSGSSSLYFSSVGMTYVKAGQVFKIKSIQYAGSYMVYGLK